MKISLILFLLCFFIILTSFTCRKNENCNNKIITINKSSSDIYVDGIFKGYPDTNYYRYSMPNPAFNPQLYKLYANQSNFDAFFSRNCHNLTLQNPESDTLMIYVFDAQVLETTPWDTVKANNLYIKRYDLSLQDLTKQQLDNYLSLSFILSIIKFTYFAKNKTKLIWMLP